MTVCPVALAVTCKKCPAFSVCPLKTVLGDHKETDDSAQNRESAQEKPEQK